MSALAALPMYDWPETRGATDAAYAALRAHVPALPPALTRPRDMRALEALWRDPALLLAQACWGPIGRGLGAHVAVLAQPDYSDVPGGRGMFYRSAVVAREGNACALPAAPGAALSRSPRGQAAINARDSLSGALAPAEDLGMPDLAAKAIVTGSHRASVRAVAEGRADWAAVDCRSWALAQAHDPAARMLVVIGWTAERVGLPFITSRNTAAPLRARLREALVALGAHAPACAS